MTLELVVDGHVVRILSGAGIENGVATPAAYEFARGLVSRLSEMKKYAAENLMDAYDTLWPEGEREPLTVTEFMQNLTSPTIIIRQQSSFANKRE